MKDQEALIRQTEQRKAHGATDVDVVGWLALEPDVGGIEGIYVAMRALKMSLADAKQMVVTHPAWRERFSGPQGLNDELDELDDSN